MADEVNEAAAGTMLAAALAFAARGIPVFPAHSSDGNGGCSCGNPECSSPAKHPHTAHGFHDATTDPETITAWWTRWPEANIGSPTGEASGVDVLDVDVQHGGMGTLQRLEHKHGSLPPTVEVLTPSGGRHYEFRHRDRPLKTGAGQLGSGLDTRGDGGYRIVPPSAGANGRAYKYMRSPDKVELADPPAWLFEQLDEQLRSGAAPEVEEVIPEGKRRQAMLSVAGSLRRRGLKGAEILGTLLELNKRCRPPLGRPELERIAFDVEQRYRPDEDDKIPSEPAADPRPIREVIETFKEWLYLPDPGSLEAVLATVAANRIDKLDPSWLLVVGPSGGGKTETIAAVTGLADVHLAATLTEAALLSGTSRRDKSATAKGGLLREVGEYGLLVLKDFGSVLSLRHEARAGVLAALREIYDGSWTRLVGTDGGRSLHWSGKLGLIAGAVPAIDQHHGVLSQLGERFIIFRLEVDDADKQARRSLRHQGREREMRKALQEAVCGLFAELDLTAIPTFTRSDEDRLVALTTLVARARSAVVRDPYRRELELVPDAEAPGRLIGALGRLLTGLRLIGVGEDEAWRVVTKSGLDSMPASRRRAVEFLIRHTGAATTTAVATRLGLPNPSTHRVLEDLAAHAVVSRESQGQGKADLWHVEPWTRKQWQAATSSEKSAPTSPTSSEKSGNSHV
jgi:hypothetical protein